MLPLSQLQNFLIILSCTLSLLKHLLTQLKDQQIEAPISLFSSNVQGIRLNYSKVEKQYFDVFKSIKHFRPFLLKMHTKIIVPFLAMRQFLMQRELGEKRENWVTTYYVVQQPPISYNFYTKL